MSEQTTEALPTEASAEATSGEATPAAPPPETAAKRALDLLLEKEAAVTRATQEQRQMAEKLSRWQKLESLSPIEAAAELGVDLASFQEHAIKNYDPNRAVTEKLSALEQRIAERDAKDLAERRQAALQEAQQHIHTYVDSSDKFELTKSLGMQGLVFDTIQQARQSGKSLSEEEAASKVEKSLSDLVEKALGNDSVRKRFQAPEPESVPVTPRSILSNETSSNPAGSRPTKPMTEQERIESFKALLAYTPE